jgi:hypothetical protein
MTKSRIYKTALAGLAVLLFCVSAQMQNWLNQERGQLGLTRLTPLKNAPPLLAFTTVALGGFRGLIANALWMRANDLQNEDKYFEMAQLADWITALEPHFTQVWTVQAWNMAYNISVKFKDHEDRWRWLKRGIELLRDRGIPLNPDEALLYRELSWLFQHKMGQNLDDAHMRYKLRWAQEMQNVLGGQPDIEALEHPKTPTKRSARENCATFTKWTRRSSKRWMKSTARSTGGCRMRTPSIGRSYTASTPSSTPPIPTPCAAPFFKACAWFASAAGRCRLR